MKQVSGHELYQERNIDKTVPVFMLLRWMCKGLGALIFPFCDQVIYFESFETQKIICHHFCFGGDESGDHRTSAYSALDAAID